MNQDHDNKAPIALSLDEVKTLATAIAAELKTLGSGVVPVELRNRFINVRAALFQRGIYDPVLVRFDSATAPPASAAEVGAQLESVAATLAAG
ncbi:MAG TPA: hypothetical protein VLU46_07020 [Thermoanaerobaculia bacterium]|nr:hypothetical protein [Thermoanaerobaculia bacterium]